MERMKWLENIEKHVLSAQVKRILRKDKSVMQEMVLPKWVSWELLYDWALTKKKDSEKQCVLCNEFKELGIDFNEKFVCDYCFLQLKNLK